MGRVTWRGVRSHPVRFLLSILAVMLGIAFVSGTFSLRAMMSSTFDDIVDQAMTSDVYVQGSSVGNAGNVPMGLADTIATIPGVERAVPSVQGDMVLVGADGTAVQSGGSPAFAVGLQPGDSEISVAAGRLPDVAGEMALETSSLKRSGLKVGDTTKVILNGKITEQKIVGELTFDAPMAGATMGAFDLATATALYAPDGFVKEIAVDAKPGTDAKALAAKITEAMPAGGTVRVQTGDAARQENKDEVASQLGFIQTFLMVFALIALFVGAFIIFNTFQMVVRQRMREIAVLRAIGGSTAQVFASVLGQAAIVGIVGSALGIVGGLGLVSVLKAVLGSIGMELSGTVPLTVGGVLAACAFGVGVAVLAAVVPAVRAARVSPVEAMRDEVPAKEHAMLRWGIVGGILLTGGIAAVVASLQGGDSAGALLGIGAVGVLFGALAIAPVIAPWIVRVLALPFLWIRPIARIARGNVTRNSVRTSITAGALMIGMALVGGASVLAASVQQSMSGIVESDLKSDFVLQGATGGLPVGALDAASKVAGVEQLNRYYMANLFVNDEPMTVASAEPSMFTDSINPRIQSGSIEDFAAGEAMVQKSFAEDNHLTLGDRIKVANLLFPDVERDVVIGAVIDSKAIESSVVVPLTVHDALVPEGARVVGSAYVQVAPGADMEQVRGGLTAAVKEYLVVSVLDKDEFASSLANQVKQVLNILYGLLGLSIVVAVIGIINTLAMSVMERTREIGMMRAVGLGKLQLAGTITIESILIAVFGAVAGLAVGVGLASAMPSVFADQGITDLVIPWGSLGVMLVVAAIIGALAALWPAVRAARLPVLESVTYD